MIKKITVTNHLGESAMLELRFPEKSGFLVRGVDGLGPSKANINTTEIVTNDGAFYNSARALSRNILFLLSFLDNPTIERTRHNSYKFFPIKRRINIKIETDTRICETAGYVESNEPNIFSDKEGTSISVICPDSYLYSTNKDVTSFITIEPVFEFPFSNESLTENLLEFGNIELNMQKTIVYSGDAPIGFTAYIHAIGSVNNLRIRDLRTQEVMFIDSLKLVAITGSDIIQDDDIVISTVKGNKFIVLQRGGVIYDIFNTLDRNTKWLTLERGNNIFEFTADNGIDNLQVRIENQVAYEGI